MAQEAKQSMTATLDILRHLAISGAIESTWLAPHGDKWYILVQAKGGTAYALKTVRNKARLFKNVETALGVAKSFFQTRVIVEIGQWQPEQKEMDI